MAYKSTPTELTIKYIIYKYKSFRQGLLAYIRENRYSTELHNISRMSNNYLNYHFVKYDLNKVLNEFVDHIWKEEKSSIMKFQRKGLVSE